MAKKTKKQQNNMTRPNSLPLLPPLWGVQSCFFCFCFFCFLFLFFWFLGLLFSGSLLAFVQWLNKTKIKKTTKKQETKKTKNKNKMTRPNSLPLLPPLWGVQSCFFVFFCFFCFLFSGSLLVFVQWLNKTKIQNPRNQQNKKKKKK